ncbi:hypothetical protein [Synergistes jonesii]|uniref:Uncharacterized protein n=1 Tax=Synergistes jonesii TaxID=2754 RepID=A0A073ISK7_9BACT|nr:hypothetical protein [Synergistes jonesii]KEJ93333.1 hypothetical protein EH55_08495 [Synergistes jonesii]OFB65090.1 hypothetical protein JS73_01000 [Synergistes jonesii]OFB65963.1 hypothetical protein JS72_00490 [Synergistes jonesii]OFB66363.1 hypothetical protein JS79_01010 [Synergistes jonesii]OFB69078.1 hypothetical protein JS78_01010 [Synergistes jonesii]
MAERGEENAAEMIFPSVTAKGDELKLYAVTCLPPEEKMSKEEKEDPWSARQRAIVRAREAGEAAARRGFFQQEEGQGLSRYRDKSLGLLHRR